MTPLERGVCSDWGGNLGFRNVVKCSVSSPAFWFIQAFHLKTQQAIRFRSVCFFCMCFVFEEYIHKIHKVLDGSIKDCILKVNSVMNISKFRYQITRSTPRQHFEVSEVSLFYFSSAIFFWVFSAFWKHLPSRCGHIPHSHFSFSQQSLLHTQTIQGFC